MNGRLYDPILHRFLAPDNYVQDPYNTQNFNRYGYVYNNPLSYTDPSGELGVFAAIAIGAAVAAATYTVTALTADVPFTAGGLIKASLIGGYSGAITFGIGSAFTSISNTAAMGFWSGAAYGAKVGAVSGFFSSAASSWMSGESFIQGIKSGVKGALIGGAIGGAIGGISSGINANRHGGNFWTGEGATFDTLAMPGDTNEVGEGLEYSTKYAKEFSDEYFGNIEGLNELYADGSVPTGYTKKGDVVFNRSGAKVSGSTRYLGKGKSDVYMYKSSFAGKEKLYLTMGHEYLHVSYNHAEIGHTRILNKAKHASIYQWQFEQARAWNYNVKYYKGLHEALKSKISPKYHYSNFGFFVFDVKLW